MSAAAKFAVWAFVAFVTLIAIAAGGASLSVAPAASCESTEEPLGSVRGVPKKFIPHYLGAAERFKLGSRGPAILAGVHKVETNFSTSTQPGAQEGENGAGAGGPMQFLQPTWDAYGVDGDRDDDRDRYDVVDAIYGAGNYLSASGAPGDWYGAIFAYNHADWYVAEVERWAKRFGGFDASGGQIETTSCQAPASGEADLAKAVKVFEPQSYKTLPAKLMAAGRAPQQVDARIYENVVWALRHYKLRVSAARESGHASHGDGSAVDLVPAGDVGSQATWERSAGAFATDLGWRASCGASGVAPACPLVGAIRFVGYEGYPNHGSPKTCSGSCPAHLHVSWLTATGGTAALVPAGPWAMVFVSPSASSDS